jgi:hypothetical protein
VPADRRRRAILPVLLKPDGRALVVEHLARVDCLPGRVVRRLVIGNVIAETDGLRLFADVYRGHVRSLITEQGRRRFGRQRRTAPKGRAPDE